MQSKGRALLVEDTACAKALRYKRSWCTLGAWSGVSKRRLEGGAGALKPWGGFQPFSLE